MLLLQVLVSRQVWSELLLPEVFVILLVLRIGNCFDAQQFIGFNLMSSLCYDLQDIGIPIFRGL